MNASFCTSVYEEVQLDIIIILNFLLIYLLRIVLIVILRLMGVSKTDKFSKEVNRSADLFHALGHPARIAILQVLINKQSCICGDLVNELPLSQSTISQHLKAFKEF